MVQINPPPGSHRFYEFDVFSHGQNVNHFKLFWRVNYCFRRKKRSGNIKTRFNMNHQSRQMQHRDLMYQNLGQTWTKWFLKKAIWPVKWQCLQDFSKVFHKNNETFSVDVNQINSAKLLWYKSCHFSTRVFFKIYRVSRCDCYITLLRQKNGEEVFILRKLFGLISI